jgi:hypothetical protein
MEVVAVVLVLLAALIPIVLPLLRPPLLALREGTGPAAELRDLERRKTAIYSTIREVGFDLRTDKLAKADYEIEVTSLKERAVDVVAQIEALKGTLPRGPEDIEAAITARRQARPAVVTTVPHEGAAFCTQCGTGLADADRFCASCGKQVAGAEE